jgi:hypothetical protein
LKVQWGGKEEENWIRKTVVDKVPGVYLWPGTLMAGALETATAGEDINKVVRFVVALMSSTEDDIAAL